MAMIAVKLVVEKLVSLLSEEAQLLGTLGRGLDDLKDDLESMKAFLQDAESRSESDRGGQIWVRQVRDVAYDTEDVLEEFLIRFSPPLQGRGFIHSLGKYYRYIQQLRARHRLAVQLGHIKEKVRSISERRNTFLFERTMDGATSVSAPGTDLGTWYDPRRASLFIDESDVVGIENPKSLLIRWLTEGEEKLTAISVVGMGGLGKTTLVKKAYDNQPVRKYFDCHSWITVSTSFTAVELLRAALKGLLEATKEPAPEGIDTMGDLQLVYALRGHLQDKRYLIVFDDVWSINAWEAVKYALPECSTGSRIIFTTRLNDLAVSIEIIGGHVYHLQPLPDEEAWRLFCMKAFRGEPKGVCPEELKDMSLSILKKCRGLPLAIVTIGGLLSNKNKVILEWKKVHDSLAAEVKTGSSFGSLRRILLLSYDDLPYHLKICYMYLSIFPEDYLIKRKKLIRLWVAERFVEEKDGLTMEQVAEDYLDELVSRSMVQAVEVNDFNKVRTCRVHDLMREIIQSKSREEVFVCIFNEKGKIIDEKVRHITIHNNFENFPQNINMGGLRSLLLFVSEYSSAYFQRSFFRGYRKLSVGVGSRTYI